MSFKTREKILSFSRISIFLLFSNSLWAQDLEPYSYINTPVDQTFLVLGAMHSEGELTPSPSLPVTDANIEIQGLPIGLAYTFDLAGDAAKVSMAAARICYEGRARLNDEQVSGKGCGFTDPVVQLNWNFYGAPALSLQEFAKHKPGLVVGTRLKAGIPVGSYDGSKLLNAGANRWMLEPGVGMSYRIGPWHIDVMGSVRWYQDNDEYFNNQYLEQDNVQLAQSHLAYIFSPGHWLSVNANYFFGGETYKDGVAGNDEQRNSRFGVTYSIALSRHQSIKLVANTGVVTRIGNDFDTFAAYWQYRF